MSARAVVVDQGRRDLECRTVDLDGASKPYVPRIGAHADDRGGVHLLVRSFQPSTLCGLIQTGPSSRLAPGSTSLSPWQYSLGQLITHGSCRGAFGAILRDMDVLDLRRLDLNLLVPLHAILVERSVSAAARRVGLTQPAVSKSLQKLRQHFGDELVVRTGRSSQLTPFAATLLPEVEDLVGRMVDVMTVRSAFEPSQTRRRFTLAVSDYFAVVLGSELVCAMKREAPSASLELAPLAPPPVYDQLDSVDAMVLPAGLDPRFRQAIHLLTERWCLVVDPRLAAAAASWMPADLAGRGFVATSLHGMTPGRELLVQMGVEVDVQISAPTFAAVPFLVAGTDLVGLAGRRMVRRLAPSAGVVAVDPPWLMPLVHYQLYSDPVRSQDAGTRWFHHLVRRVARQIDEAS